MNRQDVYWSVWSVLPHAGKAPHSKFPVVGIDIEHGQLYAYATDNYTMAVARQATEHPTLSVQLSTSEATDLARFVRPGKKAEDVEPVRFALQGGELHVGLAGDSAVFETVHFAGYTRHTILGLVDNLWNRSRVDTMPSVWDPDLAKRFAQAKRGEHDRLTFWPRYVSSEAPGAGVVVVGDSLIGAVAGMEAVPAADVARSFLSGREKAA